MLEEQFPRKEKEELKVLDVGCGPGFFPIILAEAGYNVTAVDYTEEMLEKARENAGNLIEDYIPADGWTESGVCGWNL